MNINIEKIEHLVRQLLIELGEDPEREGLLKRHSGAKAIEFLTSGYRADPKKVINQPIFSQEVHSMVIVKNIEVYSLCEHHLLPFFGRCHIGYIADGKVFGVSKLARLVDMYARRLQLQERLTEQISEVVMESINAKGVGVMIEARHLCMMMRGVEKQNSEMITSSVLGTFRDSAKTREEFLALIGQARHLTTTSVHTPWRSILPSHLWWTNTAARQRIRKDLAVPRHSGQIYSVRHNPAHRWFYVSEMRPDEVLLLKCYDSRADGRARFMPHTGFRNPACPSEFVPRESIEARTLVVFDEPL